jgi:hypothetical protein
MEQAELEKFWLQADHSGIRLMDPEGVQSLVDALYPACEPVYLPE